MTNVATQGRPVRILVSGLSALVTSGIRSVLEGSHNLSIDVMDLEDVPKTSGQPFDIVVTDYRNGIRCASAQYRYGAPAPLKNTRVFLLGSDSMEHDIRSALELGVYGYAMSSLAIDELLEGIRSISRGERFICPAAAKQLAESMSREALTAREMEVLQELARGSCNKVIAKKLNVSVGTIKSHLRALMGKLDASTRTQVVIFGITRGLVSTPRPMELRSPDESASLAAMATEIVQGGVDGGAEIRS